MKKISIIIFTLCFIGCGGKGSKERCKASEGNWNEIEKRCEEKVSNSEEEKNKVSEGEAIEEALSLNQKEECETAEKKKEGFGWVQGRCEEKAQFIIYSYMQIVVLNISSGGNSIQLQPWKVGPDCVRLKRSQWASLKITTGGIRVITVCDNTDSDESNNCALSPSIYNEEEGTHKYRVQVWKNFNSSQSSVKFLPGGHIDKDIKECKTY